MRLHKLPRNQFLALLAILDIKASGQNVTFRGINEKCGWKSPNQTFLMLDKLEARGLITRVKGRHGTIQPTVTLERV